MVTAFMWNALYETIRIKNNTAHGESFIQLVQIHFAYLVQTLLVKYAIVPKLVQFDIQTLGIVSVEYIF